MKQILIRIESKYLKAIDRLKRKWGVSGRGKVVERLINTKEDKRLDSIINIVKES